MISVKNLSILSKSLAAPLLATLMIAVVAVVFVATYLQIRGNTDQQARISELRVDVQDALLNLATAHTETLRATNMKYAQVPDDLITKASASARTYLDRVQEILDSRLAMGGLEHEALVAMVDLFKSYRAPTEETLGSITIDAFMAAMFLNDAQVRLIEIEKAGKALLTRVIEADAAIAREVSDALTFALIAVLTASVLAVLLAGSAGLFFGRAIARPAQALTESMRRLADGDTAVEIAGTNLGDEIGQMAGTVQVFKDNMVRNEELSRQTAREQEERVARSERLERLTTAFDANVRSALDVLSSAAGDMNRTSATLTEAAGSTNSQVATISNTARLVSGSVQTVASAAEELSASIGVISDQVQRQADMAQSASEAADGSRQHVTELAQQAERIGEVVTLIQDIAEQTNLLALNATIEAARAGDAGKGFAVVATEVKSLATQTAQATENIASQIQSVQTQTKATVGAIESIVKWIAEMTEVSAAVAAAVDEQNAAAQEIGRSASQAADGTGEVTSGIEAVTQAADSAGAASGEVKEAAGKLSENASTLSSLVDGFLSDVRAA
ncbi:MAG: methyl-accepting chemotaxis protein [Thalassobaculaceae bacterium]|nr:methyl-accepting chemotaxis protein [Thalassobaculaceae bacterium]